MRKSVLGSVAFVQRGDAVLRRGAADGRLLCWRLLWPSALGLGQAAGVAEACYLRVAGKAAKLLL